MKKLLFGAGFLLLAYASYVYLDGKQTQFADENKHAIWSKYHNEVKFNKANAYLSKGDTGLAEFLLDGLDKQSKEKLESYVNLKNASIMFNKGEYYLRRAEEVEYALTIKEKKTAPPPTDPENPDVEQLPPPMEQQKALHPMTIQLLNKAIDCYDNARKEIDKLSENSDANFNFSLNYLKGEIYYRVLEYMSEQNTAQELFNQTLSYYKIALRHKAGDINTVVNIELLIKNQNSLLANASDPQAKHKQMLNSRKAGLGNSKGN